MPISRRELLIGTAGVVIASAVGVAEWRHHQASVIFPGGPTGPLTSGRFASSEMHTTVGWTIAYPPGHSDGSAPLHVLVSLHGRGGDHTTSFDGGLHLQNFLAQYVRDGGVPFAIASVDGGDHSYWHPRRDGDAAGMVMKEFLPRLASHGLRTDRFGLYGWSMGAYGALYISSVLGASRVAVCVAESPAIWHEAGQSASGAFDDTADFAAHELWTRLGALRDVPLKVDCGASDGFAPVTRDLRAALSPPPAGGIEPGAHDNTFWASQAPDAIRFVGGRL